MKENKLINLNPVRGECSKLIPDIDQHYITSGAFGHIITSAQCLKIGFSTQTKTFIFTSGYIVIYSLTPGYQVHQI